MEYTITGALGSLDSIDFGAVGIKEVLQNVKTLLCTKKFSTPLDRDVGLDFNVLDMPYPKAQAGIRTEIIQALRRHEPRARIVSVKFDGDPADGRLIPRVVVEINV
ncbi:MAG: GPW/gp25 family protein [Synergistaceae bacterium]|jgi:phage baseplate assembly protein W|nr:GPW/gp25 family protein [Synergistaceae bacterium]